MKNSNKVGLSALAVTSLFASSLLPSAFAGTGGAANAGVVYGEDAAYCDAQAISIQKTDALSGLALEGATFSVANASDAAQNLGLKVYDADPTVLVDGSAYTQLQLDRIAWQNAFNTVIDDTFTSSAYGAAWLNAAISTNADRQAGIPADAYWTAVDNSGVHSYHVTQADAQTAAGVNGTVIEGVQYPTNQIVTFPADITEIANTVAQTAALKSWVNMPAQEGTVTVADFGDSVKERLDAIGAVVYSDYDAANPAAGTVQTQLAGTDSETIAVAEFDKALAEWNQFQTAVTSSGYTATWTDSDVSIDVTEDGYDATTVNWTAFVTAYNAMTAPGAFAFGLVPPTYDVIANTIGDADLETAAQIADTAAGATSTDAGASVEATSNTNGRIWVGTFGRDVTTNAGQTGTLDKSCAAQAVLVTETAAPDGYILPEGTDAQREMAASNVEDAMTTETVTNILETTPRDPDAPTPPEFESGL